LTSLNVQAHAVAQEKPRYQVGLLCEKPRQQRDVIPPYCLQFRASRWLSVTGTNTSWQDFSAFHSISYLPAYFNTEKSVGYWWRSLHIVLHNMKHTEDFQGLHWVAYNTMLMFHLNKVILCTRCVIITGTTKFQGQNLVHMRFICTKNLRTKAWQCCVKCYQNLSSSSKGANLVIEQYHTAVLLDHRYCSILLELSTICTAFTV